MKKFLALILAILMVLSLAACGESKRSSKKEKKNNTNVATEVATEEETENNFNIVTEAPTSGNIDISINDDAIEFGNLEEHSFTNRDMGIGIVVPSDWTTKSIDEIATLNRTDADTMLNDFESHMSKAQVAYMFYSSDDSTGNNINITLENLAMTNNAGINGEEYLELAEKTLKSAFDQMGATDVSTNITTVDIDGKTFDCIEIDSVVSGVELTQLQIVVPLGDYMAGITFTATDLDAFGYIDDYIYTL